jgi:RNA polymerase sigma-70 factor (ECF subfamily)
MFDFSPRHSPRKRIPEGESSALVEQVAGGSQKALGRLYVQWAPTLYSVAMRVLRSSECSEEIVDDVFVYVWQRAGAYDPARGSVGAWLSVATRYRAIDRVRRDRKHSLLQNGQFAWSATTAVPEMVLTAFQQESGVRAALSSISGAQQQLLALAFFEGLTHSEISERTGLPLGTVKSRLRRALRILRTAMTRRRSVLIAAAISGESGSRKSVGHAALLRVSSPLALHIPTAPMYNLT